MLSRSYWPADGSVPVRDTTVTSILCDAARDTPNGIALVAGVRDPARTQRLTYLELLRCAQAAARRLAARFERAERVVCLAHSTPEALVLTFAAGMAGLVLVPANPAMHVDELAYLVDQCAASGIATVPAYRGVDTLQVAEHAVERTRSVREVTILAELVRLEDAVGPLGRDAEELPELPVDRDPAPDDVAQLVYTSGTTGRPKGAMLTHRGMTNAARFGGIRFGLRAGDVYVDTMPLYHVGGQVVAFQICQQSATNVLVETFDAGLVLELLERERATVTVGVPTMLLSLIEHPDFSTRDLSSLRSVSSGGSVVPPELVRHIESSLGVKSTICFGQTETCGFISQTELEDSAEDKASTLGRPLPHLEARVVASEKPSADRPRYTGNLPHTDGRPDPDGAVLVACGEIGELQVRAPFVMLGYHDMPDETAEAFAAGEWLRTGDLVTMDERGFLRIAGRLKDMIVSGGENVFPVEIENVLCEHPAVTMAAVLGIPDRRWGEEVTAVVRPTPGADPAAAELIGYLKERLAPHKVPKRIVFTEDLPLTASGKVKKFELRERLAAGEIGGLQARPRQAQ